MKNRKDTFHKPWHFYHYFIYVMIKTYKSGKRESNSFKSLTIIVNNFEIFPLPFEFCYILDLSSFIEIPLLN
jgi:hypothetical protein